MTRISKLALMAGCSLVLTACASIDLPKLPVSKSSQPGQAQKAEPAKLAPRPTAAIKVRNGVWPQAYSDVAADPDVRFGTLPNGMRYALMKNATPTGQAAIRLRFDAGSLMETDAQQGLAHFLEHMAFNGSRNVPEGEMVKILERHGLAFGADTNASTSWTETVYKLDLPKTDDETVDISLKLMRETASELTISQAAVDRERGVVLSEERTRDSPGYQVFKKSIGFFMNGQLASKRLPIGSVDILKTASRDLIADFYGKYYRPERAVLVITGDFDQDKMEAKIKAQFGDWKAAGKAGPEPKLGQPMKREPEAMVVVQAGTPNALQMSWRKPADMSADSVSRRQTEMIDALGLAVINRRLEGMARSAVPAFIAAGTEYADEVHSAKGATLYANLQPENWKQGMSSAYVELRRVLKFGVMQDELDREITETRADLTAKVAQAKTRRTTALANGLIGSVDDRKVVTSPQQDLDLFEQTVKGLKADTVSNQVRQAFSGVGPLILVASPTEIKGGEKAVLEAFKEADAVPLTAPTVQEAVTWTHDKFGTPGQVVDRQEIADLDTVFLRFNNGLRLTVKQTKFTQDQIRIRVRMGNGKLDLPKDKDGIGWMPGWAFTEGGLSDITNEQLEKLFTGKIYSSGLALGDDAAIMDGITRPQDLDTQLQLLAAYIKEPGWRTLGVRRAKSIYSSANAQLDATPGGIMSRNLRRLLYNNDRRWAFPTNEEITNAKPEDFRAMVEPDLTQGPIEVVVVGDITVDRAIEAVAATFGALPARPDQVTPADGKGVSFPKATEKPVLLTHKGRPDQAIGFVAWPTHDFGGNMQEARTFELLSEVLSLRMTDEFREKQGATYSPWTDSESSEVYPGYGYVSAGVETPPERLAGFFADLDKIAADLRDKPISQDELDRAKKPKLEGIEKDRQSNAYWIGVLSGAQTDGYSLPAERSRLAQIAKVTPADIQKLAKAYLTSDKAWRLQVVPEKVN